MKINVILCPIKLTFIEKVRMFFLLNLFLFQRREAPARATIVDIAQIMREMDAMSDPALGNTNFVLVVDDEFYRHYSRNLHIQSKMKELTGSYADVSGIRKNRTVDGNATIVGMSRRLGVKMRRLASI